jgi:hypothetical protein
MIQSILVLITFCLAGIFLGLRIFKKLGTKQECDGCSMGKATQKDSL